MTDEQIETIACLIYGTKLTPQEYAFANMLIAAEREACAKVCENDSGDGPENGCCPTYWEEATEACAAAIRARGQA